MAGMASSRDTVHAGRAVPDAGAKEVAKRGLRLSFPQTVFLLRTVLPRRELSKRAAIELVKEQLARNEAATRSHLRRRQPKRSTAPP